MISLKPYFPLEQEIETPLDPLNKSFLNLQAITSEEEKSISNGAITADGKGSVLTDVFTGTVTGDSFTKRNTVADQDARPDHKKKAKGRKKQTKRPFRLGSKFTFG